MASRSNSGTRTNAGARTSSGARTAVPTNVLFRQEKRMLVSNPGPAELDLPLITSVYPSRGEGTPTFTRATTATVSDQDGIVRTVPSGEVRFGGARRVYNQIRNSGVAGTVAGTPGTAPTNWTISPTAGLSSTIVGTGIENGIRYVEVRIFGTTSSTANSAILPEATTQVAALTGQTWNTTAYVAIVGGNLTNISVFGLRLGGRNSGGSYVETLDVSMADATSTMQRYSTTMTFAQATTVYSSPQVIFTPTGSGVAIDITVRVGCPQLENVTGQSNQNPGEPIHTGILAAPFQGANVDGVQYFSTANGNTVASNIVTAGTGANIAGTTILGYCSEIASTNICLQSQTTDNASWSKSGITVSANATTSPSGESNADTSVEDTGVNQHRLVQSVATTSGTVYTISAYVKRGTGTRHAQLGLTGSSANIRVYFDLTNGTVGAQTNGTGRITSVGNGWYRIQATGTSDLTGSSNLFCANTNATTNASETYTGDGVSSMHWWGIQTEASGYATSYIPTTTASVTRNEDILTYAATNILSAKGAAYAEITTDWLTAATAPTAPRIINSGASAPLLVVTGANIGLFDGTGNRTGSAYTGSATIAKVASLWDTTTCNVYYNGTATTGLTFDGSIDTTVSVNIGNSTGSRGLSGTLRNIRIWKTPPTNAELISMTT